ncbi:acetylcholinesterase-like [Amblyomma americanum]
MWKRSNWEMLKVVVALSTTVSGLTVLMGFSDDEGPALLESFGNYFGLRDRGLRKAVSSLLALLGLPKDDADEIFRNYPEGVPEGRWAKDLVSDLLVICPVRFFAERLHGLGNRVHGYILHRANPKKDSGASRGYAIRLLFGVANAHSDAPEEQTLGHRMIAVMSHFFKTGELHVENATDNEGEVSLGLAPASTTFSPWVPNLRSEECEKLRRYFPISAEHRGSGNADSS